MVRILAIGRLRQRLTWVPSNDATTRRSALCRSRGLVSDTDDSEAAPCQTALLALFDRRPGRGKARARADQTPDLSSSNAVAIRKTGRASTPNSNRRGTRCGYSAVVSLPSPSPRPSGSNAPDRHRQRSRHTCRCRQRPCTTDQPRTVRTRHFVPSCSGRPASFLADCLQRGGSRRDRRLTIDPTPRRRRPDDRGGWIFLRLRKRQYG